MTLPAIDALRSRLSPLARVDDGLAATTIYARDCWPLLNLKARAGVPAAHPPEAVVFVGAPDDVTATVRWCREHRVPLVPYGGGSGVAGAAVPVHGGVALDLKRLDVLDTDLADSGIVYAGAGWLGARLEHELNRQGLTLGHFPSSLGCSTLGGYVATRSAGQLSSRHGKIEDMVVAIRFVDHLGHVRDTFAERRDLTPLLVGSEGTLGVILGAWLRVERRPEARLARGFAAPSVESGLDAIRAVLQAGHRPAVMRLYDEFDTFISGARKAGAPQRDEQAWRQAFAAWNPAAGASAKGAALRLANGLLSRTFGGAWALNAVAPRIYDACLLIVGVEEEDEHLAEASAADVFGVLSDRLQDLGDAPGKHWYANRYKVSFKMSPLIDAGMFVDTMEVATSWSNLPRLYDEVRRSMAKHVFVMAHFSHAYRCGGSIYFTFAGFCRDEDDAVASYRRTWTAAMDAVQRAGGAVTHHHGVGIMKAGRLEHDQEGASALFSSVKAAMDPAGQLNPGKLWHAEGRFA